MAGTYIDFSWNNLYAIIFWIAILLFVLDLNSSHDIIMLLVTSMTSVVNLGVWS